MSHLARLLYLYYTFESFTTPLRHLQTIFNNNQNQNTTYNFGHDVFNNNWNINNNYLNVAEVN